MKPVLALGTILLASEPLTLGDLGRASDVARARVNACQQEPVSCSVPSARAELARAMAVLHAESRVLFGVADAELAANVHALAPTQASTWVGPAPAIEPTSWVLTVLESKPLDIDRRLPVDEPAREPERPDWTDAPETALTDAYSSREPLPPTRILRISDLVGGDQNLAIAQAMRLEAIDMLEALLGKHGRTAELLYRLAELCDEEARYQHILEMEVAERTLEACDEDWCADAIVEADHRSSQAWRRRAVRIFREIEERHPRFAQVDQVLFSLGMALQEMGEEAEATTTFIRLARRYPDSAHTPDAYLLIGEQHFEAGRVYQALSAYSEAFEHPDRERGVFAKYKAAWCLYNLGELEAAFDQMTRVVDASQHAPFEAFFGDLALFAAEAGKVDRLEPILQSNGREEVLVSALNRAASRLADNGEISEAVRTWRRVQELGDASDRKAAQRSVVAVALASASSGGLATEVERMVRDVSLDPRLREDNETSQLAGLLRKAELRFHEECRKGQRASCEYAEDTYVAHLGLQPGNDVAAELHYEAGELQYRRGQYVDAFRHYQAVLNLAPSHPKAKFCAESAIHAADKALAGAIRPTPPTVGQRSLTVDELRLLQALDHYANSWPTGELASSVHYRAGYLLYEANHLDSARDRFEYVISAHPGSDRAELAANLVLDSLALEQDWATLYDTARRYQANRALAPAGEAFRSELEAIAARSSLKVADTLAMRPDGAAEAARAYLEFVDTWPASPLAPMALNNAAVYFDQAELGELAAHARQRLVAHYNDSDYAPDHLAALGLRAERRGDFEGALQHYEQLLSGFPRHTIAADARYSSALFRWGLGDWDQAVEHYDAFLRDYPRDPRADGIRFDVISVLEQAGAHERALARAEQLIDSETRSDRIMAGHMAVVRNLMALDRHAQADIARTHADEWASAQPSSVEVSAMLGELRLQRAGEAYDELVAISLDVGDVLDPVDAEMSLAKQTRLKLEAVAALEIEVVSVVEAGGAAAAQAAWAMLGQAYEEMAEALREAPTPAYLTPSQRQLYVANIHDRVWTFEERAVVAYTRVVETAERFSNYDDATMLAVDARHRLRPDRYDGLVEEQLPKARYVVSKATLGIETEL